MLRRYSFVAIWIYSFLSALLSTIAFAQSTPSASCTCTLTPGQETAYSVCISQCQSINQTYTDCRKEKADLINKVGPAVSACKNIEVFMKNSRPSSEDLLKWCQEQLTCSPQPSLTTTAATKSNDDDDDKFSGDSLKTYCDIKLTGPQKLKDAEDKLDQYDGANGKDGIIKKDQKAQQDAKDAPVKAKKAQEDEAAAVKKEADSIAQQETQAIQDANKASLDETKQSIQGEGALRQQIQQIKQDMDNLTTLGKDKVTNDYISKIQNLTAKCRKKAKDDIRDFGGVPVTNTAQALQSSRVGSAQFICQTDPDAIADVRQYEREFNSAILDLQQRYKNDDQRYHDLLQQYLQTTNADSSEQAQIKANLLQKLQNLHQQKQTQAQLAFQAQARFAAELRNLQDAENNAAKQLQADSEERSHLIDLIQSLRGKVASASPDSQLKDFEHLQSVINDSQGPSETLYGLGFNYQTYPHAQCVCVLASDPNANKITQCQKDGVAFFNGDPISPGTSGTGSSSNSGGGAVKPPANSQSNESAPH